MANAITTKKPDDKALMQATMKTLNGALLASSPYRKRFEDVLGGRADKFLRQVIANVGRNSYLQKASAVSILGAAMSAATLNLDLSPSLGLAAIIPYEDGKTQTTNAQFQIMVNGWIQLALRSGEYLKINAGFIYMDELASRDILTGDVELTWLDNGLRSKDTGGLTLEEMKKAGIVGCFCYFKLSNGFEKTVYWSLDEVDRHGRTYAQPYKKDIKYGTSKSLWMTNFRAMAQKTVIKNAIVKWGPKSAEMYSAIFAENQVTNENGENVELNDNFINIPESVQDAEVKDVKEDVTAVPSQPTEDQGDLLEGL